MEPITFTIKADHEDGGFYAFWDDPRGGGITTQGDDIPELLAMIDEVFELYFEDRESSPASYRLHFYEDVEIHKKAS